MERTLKVFAIPRDRLPAGPPEAPRELRIEAATLDGLRQAAHVRLTEDGFRVRSLTFGPTGLVAYVEARP